MNYIMTTTSAGKISLGRVLWRRLLQLDVPVCERTDDEINAEVERNYQWNFTVNFLDGVIFWFGNSFVSSATLVPLFVSKLTMAPLIIGLVAVVAQSGWYLPQLFVSGRTERVARKKPIVVNLGLFAERLPVVLWPLAALVAFKSPIWALIIFFIGYIWHGIGAGVVGPAWQDMVAICFPVKRRGRFFGSTMFAGAGVAAVGAILANWLLETFPFPLNFVYLFSIAAGAILLSWVFLALTREPVRPVSASALEPVRFWHKIGQIVRQDHNFRRFLVTRLMIALGTMGVGFVTVAAIQRWQVSDGTVAFYTMALLGGQAAGNLSAGMLADKFGHKLSLQLGTVYAALAFAVAWLSPAPEWYFLVFALLGAFSGVLLVSGILITLEFSAPALRPTYIGITNTIVGITGGLAPLLGGWIGGSFNYTVLFALSGGVCFLGVILLRWYVREPRLEPVK